MKLIILIVGMLTHLSRAESTWVPPIGIPAPGFGIVEQAPAQPAAWPGVEAAGSYYIDNTNPLATDANTYGCPNIPRMTIPSQLVVVANSLVEIHGGPYLTTITSYAWLIDSSTTNPPTGLAPAFIKGFGHVVLGASQAAINVGAASRIEMGRTDLRYTIIEGIHFDNMPLGITGLTAHHVCIRNCETTNTHAEAMDVTPQESGTFHDIVFYSNLIHDTADWNNTSSDWDYHGIGITTYGRTSATSLYNVWVLDNTFYHCSGDSVQVNADTAGNAALHHVYIGRNTAYENRQSGFWCKEASHVIMSQNVIHTMNIVGSGLSGYGMGSQYGPDNLWFLFNEIYACQTGFGQSDSTHAVSGSKEYYVGNYIHDLIQPNHTDVNWNRPMGWAFQMTNGVVERHIIDNTMVNIYGGLLAYAYGPIYFQNNIIENLRPNEWTAHGVYNNHIDLNFTTDVAIDHCLIYGVSGGTSQLARVTCQNISYTTLASGQRGTGKFANCVQADPLLVGVKLQAASPAIDGGVQADVYQTFQTLYGIDIRRGFDGGRRPMGAGWDIGACEFNPPTPVIAPPKNPAVVPIPTPQ